MKEAIEKVLDNQYIKNEQLAQLRAKYPEGTSICLIKMGDDIQRVPDGTMGTVAHVDDMGTIHMRWATGSSLGLIEGVDEFEIIHPTRVTLTWGNVKRVSAFARESEAVVFATEALMTCDKKKYLPPEVKYEKISVTELLNDKFYNIELK